MWDTVKCQCQCMHQCSHCLGSLQFITQLHWITELRMNANKLTQYIIVVCSFISKLHTKVFKWSFYRNNNTTKKKRMKKRDNPSVLPTDCVININVIFFNHFLNLFHLVYYQNQVKIMNEWKQSEILFSIPKENSVLFKMLYWILQPHLHILMQCKVNMLEKWFDKGAHFFYIHVYR